ncbi:MULTISPECIES: hypothetical protein [Rhizobium]|uniref:hypothetical protein n=1 Tax=Rhizobium TaxID=379 RepID=UPI001C82F7B3|nr:MULTISPECIES: hypothetical protein [Rhizobium]MBX4963326.1 hypothetical protein [Rhizobium binae]MBX5000941.1 hypothetical protein [Rhizobium lentis]MBX5020367.1 hypothetical protein [Rhizobium lentis]
MLFQIPDYSGPQGIAVEDVAPDDVVLRNGEQCCPGPSRGLGSLLEGFQWALSSGANVISMSLGFDFPSYCEWLVEKGYAPEAATSQALETFMDNIRLFECAAGDEQAPAIDWPFRRRRWRQPAMKAAGTRQNPM